MGVCQYEMECSGAGPHYIRAFSLNGVGDSFIHSFLPFDSHLSRVEEMPHFVAVVRDQLQQVERLVRRVHLP